MYREYSKYHLNYSTIHEFFSATCRRYWYLPHVPKKIMNGRILQMIFEIFPIHFWSGSISPPKPSLKIGTANAICWNSLGLFKDYGLDHIFKEYCFFCFSVWKWFCETSQNFNSFRQKKWKKKCVNDWTSCNFSNRSFSFLHI